MGDSPAGGSLGHSWGAAAPSPSLGHPQVHAAGARLDPSSTVGPGEDGLGYRTSPRTCTQLLFPSTTFGTSHIHTHAPPSTPGQGAAQKKCPSVTAAPERPWSQARQRLLCSQLQILSKHGLNLIKAELDSRLKHFGCRACRRNFM